MGIKENCDQWVQLAYEDWLGWLRSQKKNTYLRESTKNIIAIMWKNVKDRGREKETWQSLELLKRLAENYESFDNNHGEDEYLHESPEILLECAVALYQLKELKDAATLLKTSIGEFPNHTLRKAIGYWIYGCVQWQNQAHLEDVLVSWEKSLQIARDVESDNRNDLPFVKKCQEIRECMAEAIQYASVNIFPPPVAEKAKSSRSARKPPPARVRAIPVYGPIPAGPPAWIPPEPDDFAEINSINFNDMEYYFHSLHEGLTINLNSGRTYFFLKVKGNSMNMAKPVPIEDGDYVLMVKQDAAMPGDIVAVEIIGVDEVATLKRYRFRDGQYRLEPETDDPALAEHISITKDFYIRGIALAVLKPIE